MNNIIEPSDHPKLPKISKVGILIVNLGTPDNTDTKSVRRYLKEFLSDRRVVDIPRLFWWIILNLIILNVRPKKSGDAYKRIWLKDDIDGSPLRRITRLQKEALVKKFQSHGIIVEYAMRYGSPSIKNKLSELKNYGCNKILVLSLYPQYAAPTTATVNDEVCRWMLKQRWQPSIRLSSSFHDHPAYINALTNSIIESFKKNGVPDMLLLSFHGSPLRYLIEGDPYHCHCVKTARLIKENLKINEKKIFVSFQSRFGSEPWLKPYTDETLKLFGKKKINHLSVITPGFVADNLETLEEINIEGKEIFIQNGGKKFTYIPCLNDSKDGINVLNTLCEEELGGWLKQ